MTRQPHALGYTRCWLSWLLLFCTATAHSDGFVARHGRKTAFAGVRATSECGDDRAACATNVMRVLTGLAIGVVTTSVGANRGIAAGGIAIDVAAVGYPLGTADLGKIEALYPDAGSGARVRFTAADLNAVFSCRDPQGIWHPPILGHLLHRCVPGSRFGFGARIAELAWDPETRRRTARWSELAAVVNLVGATSSMQYLHGHLDAALGFGGESVWHGRGEARSGSDHMARASVGLRSVVRSSDGHWEASLEAMYRPGLIGAKAWFADYGLSADVTAFYNLLVDSSTVISAGLAVRASRWSDPSTAIESFASATAGSTLFTGAVFRVRRELQP